jgi:hypothetical protein
VTQFLRSIVEQSGNANLLTVEPIGAVSAYGRGNILSNRVATRETKPAKSSRPIEALNTRVRTKHRLSVGRKCTNTRPPIVKTHIC